MLIEHIEILDVDVYTELAQLDPTKAIGIDGITGYGFDVDFSRFEDERCLHRQAKTL